MLERLTQAVPKLKSFTLQQQRKIKDLFEMEKIDHNDFIFKENEVLTHAFVILQGSITLTSSSNFFLTQKYYPSLTVYQGSVDKEPSVN